MTQKDIDSVRFYLSKTAAHCGNYGKTDFEKEYKHAAAILENVTPADLYLYMDCGLFESIVFAPRI